VSRIVAVLVLFGTVSFILVADGEVPHDAALEPSAWHVYAPVAEKSFVRASPTAAETLSATSVATAAGPTPSAVPTAAGTPAPRQAVAIVRLQCRGRDEYVVVENQGASTVELERWRLRSVVGDQWFAFPSMSLEPRAALSIHSGPDAPPTGGPSLRWTLSYIWNNDGDEAELTESTGLVVSRASCQEEEP